MKVEINKKRLEYLLALYKMSVDDLLSLLNKGRKRITGAADISGDSIDLGVLKRIGEIFDKEVSFFQDYSKLSTCPKYILRKTNGFATALSTKPYWKPPTTAKGLYISMYPFPNPFTASPPKHFPKYVSSPVIRD
jgi:hypothetical protein